MKDLKFALALVLVASLIATTFAFTAKSKRSVQLYFYAQGTCKQAIAPASGQTDCRDNSIGTGNLFRDVNNWSTSSNGTTFASSTNYFAAIAFDNSQITLQQALDGAYNYYITHSYTFPDDGGPIMIGFASVFIRRTGAHY